MIARIQNRKSGFGLMEVLAAAVVLGFLIVGLTQLQKGNREAVLRIRARDVAQTIATDVIDSLKRLGFNSISITQEPIQNEIEKTFEGAVGHSKILYRVNINITENQDDIRKSEEQTALTRANSSSSNELAYDFARIVDVSVEWEFKNSTQSIQISEVIK